MTSLFYLALTDGTTTIELTDGTNYSVSDESGWLPNVAFDTEQRTVVDSIPINILGAYASGGRSQAGRTRVNYIALLTMLRQIERGQQGDGGVVTLVYTSPNSAPARRIACQVTRWDPSTFPTDVSSVINLPQNEINEVVLTLEHRVPWVWTEYVYANLYPDSAWDINPSPVSPGGISTVTQALATGYYGGLGKLRITNGISGLNYIYAANPMIAVTSGTPVIVTYSAGWLTGISAIGLMLIESASTTIRSNIAVTTVTGAMLVADGYRITATLTPTITGNVRLMWEVNGSVLREAEFAEVFVHATAEEVWHRDTALEGVEIPSGAVATHPINRLADMPPTPSPAPTDLEIAGFPDGATYPLALGRILAIVGAPAALISDYPVGTMAGSYSSFADAARSALGGNVLRFTPAAANTYYEAPYSTTIMIDAMGSPALSTTRNLQIILCCINNSATSTFTVYANGYAVPNTPITSRTVDIPPSGAVFQHVFIPMIFSGDGFFDYRLQIAGSVAGQTLDIDRVIIVGVDDMTFINETLTNYNINQLGTINYDQDVLTTREPVIYANISVIDPAAPNRARLRTNDDLRITTRPTEVRVIVDAFSTARWQPYGAAVTTLTATLYRPPAFDAPL